MAEKPWYPSFKLRYAKRVMEGNIDAIDNMVSWYTTPEGDSFWHPLCAGDNPVTAEVITLVAKMVREYKEHQNGL